MLVISSVSLSASQWAGVGCWVVLALGSDNVGNDNNNELSQVFIAFWRQNSLDLDVAFSPSPFLHSLTSSRTDFAFH